MPVDSLVLRAWFECDSLNRVLMRASEEQKSSMESSLKFDGSQLEYRAKSKPDTVWLPTDSIYIYREVPFVVEVPVVEYRQRPRDVFFGYTGKIALAGLTLLALLKALKKYLKII